MGLVLAAAVTGCGRPGDREFRAGLKEMNAGRWVEARTWMERSIARRPGSAANALAYNYLGLACLRLEDLPSAATAFEESRRLDPQRAEPLYNLASLRAQAGDTLQASALLNEAAQLDPASPRAMEMLGYLYGTQQRWTDAQAPYEEALKRSPDSPRIRTALAGALYRAGSMTGAVEHLTAVLDRSPNYAPAAFNLFVVYEEGLNLPGAAEAWARRFMSLAGANHPQSASVAAWLKQREAERSAPPRRGARTPAVSPEVDAALKEARAFAKQGAAGSALNACLKAAQQARIARNESSREQALALAVELAPDQPRAHMAQGQFLMEKKRTAEALAAFRLATTLGPNLAEAHASRGDAAGAAGEWDDALVSLRRALELDPAHADARWQLAQMYDQKMSRPADALQEYREFARLHPGDPRSMRAQERIRALEAARPPAPPVPAARPSVRTSEPPALPSVGRALGIAPAARPDSGEAVKAFERGRVQVQQKNLDRAIQEFRRSLELNPGSAEVWFNLALACQGKGDADLALDAYRHGLDGEPRNGTMRYNAALALHSLGRIPDARAQLEYLVRTEPAQANVRYLLGMIEASTPGRTAEARTQLEEFLRLAPKDPSAPSVRDWLKASR